MLSFGHFSYNCDSGNNTTQPCFQAMSAGWQRSLYSCYYSPEVSLETFQAYLDDLEESIRKWSGPIIVAGDFNAKSRSWSGPGGPEDR